MHLWGSEPTPGCGRGEVARQLGQWITGLYGACLRVACLPCSHCARVMDARPRAFLISCLAL